MVGCAFSRAVERPEVEGMIGEEDRPRGSAKDTGLKQFGDEPLSAPEVLGEIVEAADGEAPVRRLFGVPVDRADDEPGRLGAGAFPLRCEAAYVGPPSEAARKTVPGKRRTHTPPLRRTGRRERVMARAEGVRSRFGAGSPEGTITPQTVRWRATEWKPPSEDSFHR